MKKILWFTSKTPTEEEKAEAAKIKAVFRNPDFYFDGDSIESFDELRGSPPQKYIDVAEEKARILEKEVNIVNWDQFTVAELREYAEQHDIDIPSQIRAKADIIAWINSTTGE